MAILRLLPFFFALAVSQTPDEICQYFIDNLQQNILDPSSWSVSDYGVMLFAGKGIGDMGSRGMCETLQMKYMFLTYSSQAVGTCFYPECSSTYLNQNKETILQLFSLFLPIPEQLYPQVNFRTEDDIQEPIQDDIYGGYIATTTVVVLLGALCLFGVLVHCTHLFDRESGLQSPKNDSQVAQNKTKLGQFFLSFSAWFNFKNLLKTGGRGPTYDPNLEVFAGVRTFSMMYVILGHVCQGYASGINDSFMELLGSWFGVFAKGGEFAVDVFFFMAAFLATYVMMSKFTQRGWINPLMVYFHRFWRLIFPLVIATFVGSYILAYLIRGPLIQFYYRALTVPCEKRWWSTFLFINNLYPWKLNDECMSHTWYLANDFQFFLLLPFLLMIMKRSALLGYSLLLLLAAVSVTLSIWITIHYELYIPTPVGDTSALYYTKPWCRIPPYLLGVFLGHLYYMRKQYKLNKAPDSLGNKLFSLYQRSAMCSWISVIIGIAMTSFFIFIYHTALHGGGWSLTVVGLYNALSRGLFVLGMMLVLIPTFEGRLTWLKLFMSCEYFQVIGKLTYSAYLIHIPVGVAYLYSIKYTPYGSIDTILYHYFGMYTLAYLSALILFLLSEYPPLNIERFILFPKKKKTQGTLLPERYIGSEVVKTVK